MPKFWLLKGEFNAPGWNALRKDYDDKKIEIVHLDPKVWAMIEADDPPEGYDGLTPGETDRRTLPRPSGQCALYR